MPGDTEGSSITISGGQASRASTTRVYDPETGTITDTDTGIVYHEDEGLFTSAEGDVLTPGFTANVGFDNFVEVFTGTRYSGFLRVLVWTIAFSACRCCCRSSSGSAGHDAQRQADARPHGLPIAVDHPVRPPGFMMALVFRGLFNRTFGINRWLGIDVGWLETPALAMFSLILVNVYLGYPYMFLVSTGALQSIPTDLKEAAFVDGANGFTTFRKITLPLLLTAISPLLIASFAFNFNNFTVVYLLTGGGPRSSGESAGATDYCCHVDLPHRPRHRARAQGLASALSVLIFIIVAAISAIGFKYTKAYEEVR